MTTFTELGLDQNLLKALETEGYTTPTPIQAQGIPVVMSGRDLLGIAQTGTGKTAAFALPILHKLAASPQPLQRKTTRVLVLSPTRELATQIAESFKTYGRHLGLKIVTVLGGVGLRPQIQALAGGADIVVATPGRLLDHMNTRSVTLENTEILVVDEADQMMDLGFIRPLRQIIAKIPARRQTLFFSATMPHEIGALAAELLRDPAKVSVTPVSKTADRVAQKIVFIEQTKKRTLLSELFADENMTRALVFTRTKRGADRVARHLEANGVKSAAIHGNKSQGQREHALASFKASKIRALIATDIAARGLDIDAVSHVINFELPNIPESYVHRIGRTARAGAEGIAISLVDNEEREYLRDIEKLTRQQIPSTDRRNDPEIKAPAEDRKPEQIERDDRQERRGDRRNGRPHRPAGSRPFERGPKRHGDHGGRGDRPDRGPDRSEHRSHKRFGDNAGRSEQTDRPDLNNEHGSWRPERSQAPRADRSHEARSDRGREPRPDRGRDARPERGHHARPDRVHDARQDRPNREWRKPNSNGAPRSDRPAPSTDSGYDFGAPFRRPDNKDANGDNFGRREHKGRPPFKGGRDRGPSGFNSGRGDRPQREQRSEWRGDRGGSQADTKSDGGGERKFDSKPGPHRGNRRDDHRGKPEHGRRLHPSRNFEDRDRNGGEHRASDRSPSSGGEQHMRRNGNGGKPGYRGPGGGGGNRSFGGPKRSGGPRFGNGPRTKDNRDRAE